MAKIGDRIAHLRKIKGFSQTELAKLALASREAIGKYERNEAMPSVETAKNIADILEVTLDFLVDEKASASFDKETVKRINGIQELNEQDKKSIFSVIDAFIRDTKAKQAYS